MVRLALLYLAMFSFKGPTFHTKGTCDSIPDPTWLLEVTFVIFCAKCPQNHFHPQIKNPKSKRKNPKQVSFLLATLSFCRCGNLFFGEKNPNETERRISCLEFVGRWCSQICQVDDCERDLQVLPEGNCWETSTSEWLIFWCRGSCPKGCLECCCPPLKKNFKENIRQKVQETENHVIHQFFILVLYLVNLCFNDESTLKLDRFFEKKWPSTSTRMAPMIFLMASFFSHSFWVTARSLLRGQQLAAAGFSWFMTFLTGGATRKEWPQTAGQHA